MKLNARTYLRVVTEPFATQELENGIHVDLHYMNENPFYTEYASKGRFAIWATLDGLKYDLLVEKGYYEVMHELYDEETNNIWMNFWKKIAQIRKKYTFYLMLPIMLAYFAILITVSIVFPKETWILIVGIVVALLLSMFGNRFLSKKMQEANIEAVNDIKKAKGAKRFEKLLKDQDAYSAKFFGYSEELEEEAQKEVQAENQEEISVPKEEIQEAIIVENEEVEVETTQEEPVEENNENNKEE